MGKICIFYYEKITTYRFSYSKSINLSYCVVTKYRYKVLTGDIKERCRALIIQICEAENIEILKGVVSSNYVDMHIEYPPKLNISTIVKQMKGRTSRKIQQEFLELKKRYLGNHFWGTGYGAWSTGNITDKMVNEYLEHHRKDTNDKYNFILE